ncbi:MAG: spermidine/putrescine ABC transporter substrate-binding protein [Nitrospirae bacterium]|nr:spermidine/putrescine ABC transporter substrate-binding protein [Nitrospirota bacterium]
MLPILRQITKLPNRTFIAALLCAAILACQPAPDDGKKPVPKTSRTTPTLYYFTWSDYVGPELIEAFEKQHGVKVVVDTFSSNEELLAKLQSGATGYDVIVPSDFMAAIMMKLGLLAELDPALVPNARSIEDRLRGLPFDPEQRHAVPYLWGTVGIGYDSAIIPSPPDSWDVLWDPRYKGRISMLNDQREVLGAALRSIGASLNSRDPGEIARAKQKLIAQKPLVKTYTSDHYDQLLATGEVILAHGWGGPVARAMIHKPSIKYVVPREGGTIWADCLAVLKISPNKALAMKFVNYLLDRDVAVRTTTRLLFAHANREVKALVAPEIRNNPAVYAPEAVLDRLEWATDVGQAIRLYDRAWTELKLSALQPGETVTHLIPNLV